MKTKTNKTQTKPEASKVPISQRAAMLRINRKLQERAQMLRACRPQDRAYEEMGAFYLVDLKINAVLERRVDLTALGLAVGALKGWEQVEEKSQ